MTLSLIKAAYIFHICIFQHSFINSVINTLLSEKFLEMVKKNIILKLSC